MGALEDRLQAMGYTLPPPFKFPNPNRTGCVVVGPIVFVSGHGRDLPSLPKVKHTGKVGRDLTIEEGYATARAVALSMRWWQTHVPENERLCGSPEATLVDACRRFVLAHEAGRT